MMPIHSQADLDAANLQVAWSMAPKMTREQYTQLCRVTVQHWRREGERYAEERARLEQGVGA